MSENKRYIKRIEKLALEYEQAAIQLDAKIDSLYPLLYIYNGEDLILLRRRIKLYYEMANNYRKIASILRVEASAYGI